MVPDPSAPGLKNHLLRVLRPDLTSVRATLRVDWSSRGIVPVPPMEMKGNGTVLEHPTTPSASVVGKLSARRPPSDLRRSFPLNVALRCYYCHGCRRQGNQLELWAAATKLPLHQPAIDICHRLGRDVLRIRRWGWHPRSSCESHHARHRLQTKRKTVSTALTLTRDDGHTLYPHRRRGHRYSAHPSNRTISINYSDRMSINYLDHSQLSELPSKYRCRAGPYSPGGSLQGRSSRTFMAWATAWSSKSASSRKAPIDPRPDCGCATGCSCRWR